MRDHHRCDTPHPSQPGYLEGDRAKYSEGDTWECHICHKVWTRRFLHDLAEEFPTAYAKPMEILKKKYGEEHPFLVWTTRKRDK